MATYDLTSKTTQFVASNSIASLPSDSDRNKLYVLEKYIDIANFIANGYTFAAGDVFQALEIPADAFVLFAGAEVHTAFNGTAPTVDIDFAGGDDIVDGGDVSTTGWLASGTNGQALTTLTGAASTFAQAVATTDTIDVTLNAGAADVTEGVLRVVAGVVSLNPVGKYRPTIATRDQL